MNDIPVLAITSDGQTQTTMIKAINDLTKRTAPKCASCGQYSTHENLIAVKTNDGSVARICTNCVNDKVNDGSGKTYKQVHAQQWADAVKQIDEMMAKSRISVPPMDALAKAQASDRLAKAYDNAMAYLRRMAVPPGGNDRVTRLVKAEITRRKTAEIVAKTKRTKRKIAKMRRRADEVEVTKGEAEQMLANLLESQAAGLAQLDQLSARVETVYRNAERAYGAVAKQRDIEATVERGRLDQIRADLHFKASQETDPDIRRFYLSQAENPNAVN
jgi:hypothetical protein